MASAGPVSPPRPWLSSWRRCRISSATAVGRGASGRPADLREWLRRYWRYQIAKTASLAANLAITAVLIHAGLPAEIANTAAVLACAIPNYLVSEHLVFRHSSTQLTAAFDLSDSFDS